MSKFIVLTRNEGEYYGPVAVNVDHIAWIGQSKDGLHGVIRMAMDVGAGLHVSESAAKITALIKRDSDG